MANGLLCITLETIYLVENLVILADQTPFAFLREKIDRVGYGFFYALGPGPVATGTHKLAVTFVAVAYGGRVPAFSLSLWTLAISTAKVINMRGRSVDQSCA